VGPREARTPGASCRSKRSINETLYHERFRLRGHVHAPHKDQDRAYWKKVSRTFPNASSAPAGGDLGPDHPPLRRRDHRPLQPRSCSSAHQSYGTKTLSVLLNSMSPIRWRARRQPRKAWTTTIAGHRRGRGAQSLSKLGTVILAPRTCRNLDSVILARARAHRAAAFLYGAGLQPNSRTRSSRRALCDALNVARVSGGVAYAWVR